MSSNFISSMESNSNESLITLRGITDSLFILDANEISENLIENIFNQNKNVISLRISTLLKEY